MSTTTPLPLIDIEAPRKRGIGVLEALDRETRIALPLSGVDIQARIAERVAEVTVTEKFSNQLSQHLEAVYIFPLSGAAAVTDFEMRVGQRVVKGMVQEREQASKDYAAALAAGKRAALLEQERDDVFTVQVGNIPPGEEITISLKYCERLPYFANGQTELHLPLVVAPRYIAGKPEADIAVGKGTELDTDNVPDASRISPPRLAPGFDPKVSLSLAVELLAGQGNDIDDLCCSQHATKTSVRAGVICVQLSLSDEPLNRDFVLRWRIAANSLRESLVFAKDAAGDTYGMLTLVPPACDFTGVARDVIFVLDRSGSMEGVKMASASRACSLLLNTLRPGDRYGVLAFDDQIEWMPSKDGSHLIDADEQTIMAGEAFLRRILARGGTELEPAVAAAVQQASSRSRAAKRMPIIVLITDGQVGDESGTLQRIQKSLGDIRIFAIGIDTAVNQQFLSKLARLGGGTATFVVPGAQLEDALQSISREIGAPLMVDIRISGDTYVMDTSSVAPCKVPDLFEGRAVTVFFRGHEDQRNIRVSGHLADGSKYESVLKGQEITLPAVAALWARVHITDLEDAFRIEHSSEQRESIRQSIIKVSVAQRILSRFTAFIAVDEEEVVNKSGTYRSVVQPVEMPDRWAIDAPAPAAMARQSGCFKAAPALEVFGTAMGMSQEAEDAAFLGGWSQSMDGAAPATSAPQQASLLNVGANNMLWEVAQTPPPASQSSAPMAVDQHLITLFDGFIKAFDKAWGEVDAGHLPDAANLEKWRSQLSSHLARFPRADRLPLLQRFLKFSAIELIACLHVQDMKAAGARAIFDRHRTAYAEVKEEIALLLESSERRRRFWEGSI